MTEPRNNKEIDILGSLGGLDSDSDSDLPKTIANPEQTIKQEKEHIYCRLFSAESRQTNSYF